MIDLLAYGRTLQQHPGTPAGRPCISCVELGLGPSAVRPCPIRDTAAWHIMRRGYDPDGVERVSGALLEEIARRLDEVRLART